MFKPGSLYCILPNLLHETQSEVAEALVHWMPYGLGGMVRLGRPEPRSGVEPFAKRAVPGWALRRQNPRTFSTAPLSFTTWSLVLYSVQCTCMHR